MCRRQGASEPAAEILVLEDAEMTRLALAGLPLAKFKFLTQCRLPAVTCAATYHTWPVSGHARN